MDAPAGLCPGELSFQARLMIRSQGRQMEHESVDQYVRRQEHGRI